jgi:type IV pilus assembly protein PilB
MRLKKNNNAENNNKTGGKNPCDSEHNSSVGSKKADQKPEFAGIKGLSTLYSPTENKQKHVRDLVDVLVEMGAIDSKNAKQVRDQNLRRSGDLEKYMLAAKVVNKEDILIAKAQLYGFEFVRLDVNKVDPEAFDKLDIKYVRNNHIIPYAFDSAGKICVATDEPANVFAIDDVKRQTAMDVKVAVCSRDDIDTICDELDEAQVDYDFDDIMSDMAEIEVVEEVEEDVEDLEKSAGQSPVIKYVNFLLADAFKQGASDIHIEPKDKYTRVRYRIDGVLFDNKQAPAKMHQSIVSRLKIMSNLDISERRLPQDGKITVIMGKRSIDLRVSVLPTSHGEKVVVRILDSKSILMGLNNSGMEPGILEEFKQQIEMPNGILLVTGPTGSGKSTTLYSALTELDGDRMNISTVEDPVEYNLDFCNQVLVREQIGMTFAAALRSLLRQDPDIIMVGEIRDSETARIAVQAALTGHLVLSTLHTNDAPSSISRLVDIGIEPYLVAASLNGVLAQRLVRRICDECKEPYKASGNIEKYLQRAGIEASDLVHGAGCDKCRHTGYAGRVGIFEMLTIDDKYRELINTETNADVMSRAFAKSGKPTLFMDGMQKVKKGLTTVEEVLRVTEVYGINEDEEFVENEAK